MARIGYVSSKLGDTDRAISWTKKALQVAPEDSELLLEMASRYVDAQKYTDAIAILKRLTASGRARGEVHLRLGYAYLNVGDLPRAERELQVALSTATAPAASHAFQQAQPPAARPRRHMNSRLLMVLLQPATV